MDTSSNDPLELLDRCPALRELLHIPGVQAAIEAGQPHALYDALRAARKKGGVETRRLDEVLADSRLFTEPVAKAPGLFTFNGFGGGLAGRSDVREDGSYVTNHFFRALFIPVFPLGRYHVWTEDKKDFYFLGRLPLTPGLRLWRRLFGAGAVAAVAAVLLSIYVASGTQELRVLNGLDIPVEVTVGEEMARVAPGQRVTIVAETGEQSIVARRVDGEVIEEVRGNLEPFTDLAAYNILGAASLYAEGIRYAETPDDRESELVFYGGQSLVSRKHVDFLFRDPPDTIQLRNGKSTVRWLVDAGAMNWRDTAAFLAAGQGKSKEALALMRQVVRAQEDDSEALFDTFQIVFGTIIPRTEEADLDLTFAMDVVADRPGSVEAHRMLQQVRLMRGEMDELLKTYRERFDADPSADNGYLLARFLPAPESRVLVEKLLEENPSHPWLLRSGAWRLLREHRWKEAAEVYDLVERVAPAKDVAQFEHRAAALVGSGRTIDALRLADGLDEARGIQFHSAVLYAQLVQLAGDDAKHAHDHKLRLMFAGQEASPIFKARLAIAAGLDADDAILALEDDTEKAALVIEQQLLRDPDAALSMAKQAGAGVEMLLQRHSLFLLLGPAVKKDERELLEAIESRLKWLFEPSLEYVRTGREVPELDFIGLDDRAALDVARSWNVSGAERNRLLAAALASDPLRGPAWRAAGQWFATRMAQGR